MGVEFVVGRIGKFLKQGIEIASQGGNQLLRVAEILPPGLLMSINGGLGVRNSFNGLVDLLSVEVDVALFGLQVQVQDDFTLGYFIFDAIGGTTSLDGFLEGVESRSISLFASIPEQFIRTLSQGIDLLGIAGVLTLAVSNRSLEFSQLFIQLTEFLLGSLHITIQLRSTRLKINDLAAFKHAVQIHAPLDDADHLGADRGIYPFIIFSMSHVHARQFRHGIRQQNRLGALLSGIAATDAGKATGQNVKLLFFCIELLRAGNWSSDPCQLKSRVLLADDLLDLNSLLGSLVLAAGEAETCHQAGREQTSHSHAFSHGDRLIVELWS